MIEYPPPTDETVQMVEQDLLDQMPASRRRWPGRNRTPERSSRPHPRLKVVARVGVGYDAVDVQAATDHGVVVTIAPGTNQDAVSEHCFMLLLLAIAT